MFEVKCVHLCTSFKQENNGNVSMGNIFTALAGPSFPFRFPLIYVVVRIEFSPHDGLDLLGRIIDPNGNVINEGSANAFPRKELPVEALQKSWIPLSYKDLSFNGPGKHCVNIVIRDQLHHSTSLNIYQETRS